MKEVSGVLLLLVFSIVTLFLVQKRDIPYTLPKQIWTHWNDTNFPPHFEMNLKNWKRLHPDWTITVFTTKEFLETVTPYEIPYSFHERGYEHQADWIRMKLLKKYGGCWMDSGILLNTSLESLYSECLQKQADLLVFQIPNKQTDPRFPVAENWFLMAPKESPVICAWLEEYEYAMQSGFYSYKEQLLAEDINLQNIFRAKEDTYLTQHGCFQKIIQKRLPEAKILYKNSVDSMFKLHTECDWKKECIDAALRDVARCKKIPYIKLRGIDRKGVDLLPLLTQN